MSRALDDPSLDDVGTFAGKRFANGIPQDLFAALRRDDPCHWSEYAGADGGWNLVRHADVVDALRDTTTFSSHLGGTTLKDQTPEEIEHNRSMLHLDPPEHQRVRDRFAARFRPGHVENVASWAAARNAEEIVASVHGRSELDLVTDIAVPMVGYTLSDVLGVDRRDRDRFVRLSALMLGDAVPDDRFVNFSVGERSPGAAAFLRGSPSESMMRLLRAASERTVEDSSLLPEAYDDDTERLLTILSTAGTGMTQNALTGTLLEVAVSVRNSGRQLADFATDLDGLIEEGLRFSTPLLHVRRTVARPIVRYGRRMERGDKVVLWFASANFDDEVFADARTFRLWRRPNPHVSFGRGGPHFCLGAALARVELRAVLLVLLRELTSIRVDGPVERLASNFVSEIPRLPARVTWRSSLPRETASLSA